MARKKNNDTMKLAAVSAVVSLFIVVVFFGGSLTGNAVYQVDVEVVAAAACTFSPVDGSTLDFGTVSAIDTDSSTVDLTVENSGAVDVDVDATLGAAIPTIFGASNAGNMEAIAVLEGGSATNSFSSKGNLSTTTGFVVETLKPAASEDLVTITLNLESGSGQMTAATQAIPAGLTVTCAAA